MTKPRVIVTPRLFKALDRVKPLRWVQAVCPHPRWIFIRPERKDDAALIAHETVHAEQQRRVGWWRFWLLYITDDAFRFDAELRAYRVQAALRPRMVYVYAMTLATNYRLDVTYEEALAALRGNGGALWP